MAKGEQLNLRLETEFMTRLEADAKRFGLGKNVAAVQILETYYEHWRAMQEDLLQVREAHLQKIHKQTQKRQAG